MTPLRTDKVDAEPTGDGAQPELGAPAGATTVSRRRRRWYQFSLWSLFALTLLTALALLGWRWTIAPYRAEAKTMALVKRLGGSYQSAPAPPWMSRVAGEELGHITLVNLADCDQPEEYLDPVARLPRLEILVVGGKAFADEHLEGLSGTKSLQRLILDCTAVSDDALAAAQTANPDLKTYRSQRRAIAAITAGHGTLAPTYNAVDRELQELLGADFFLEPTALQAFERLDTTPIEDLRSLRFASLDGPFSDADLSAIAKSPSLFDLGLDSPQITDDGVRHVVAMPQLQTISLRNSQLTNAGLAILASNRSLTRLFLANTQVNDDGLAHLADHPTLEELNIDGTSVTDTGLAHLRALTKLMGLGLNKTKITDAGMPELKRHKKLSSLGLSDTLISDDAMMHLAELSNLQTLSVGNTSISDRGLSRLKDLKNMQALWLVQTKITDAAMPYLMGFTQLRSLHLRETEISDAAVEHLAKLSSLQYVNVRNTQMTPAGLAKLRKALPRCHIDSAAPQPKGSKK